MAKVIYLHKVSSSKATKSAFVSLKLPIWAQVEGLNQIIALSVAENSLRSQSMSIKQAELS